ncbi:hypothetical protein D9V28_05950 [Mycetocola zhadangensis]|uniref:DUF2530 domain-containing protein n=2 Tax=Mycetocola zhadangensis TaxID=1164595 RepID=A0A3L7J7B2_9MICO|nr:hypothetical protein D9V28_05950 [Mycetocola zhadangensis]
MIMTEQKNPSEQTRARLGTTQMAWLLIAGLLSAIALLYAVIAPLLTKNPAGIPLGILCGLSAFGIVLIVRRSRHP